MKEKKILFLSFFFHFECCFRCLKVKSNSIKSIEIPDLEPGQIINRTQQCQLGISENSFPVNQKCYILKCSLQFLTLNLFTVLDGTPCKVQKNKGICCFGKCLNKKRCNN